MREKINALLKVLDFDCYVCNERSELEGFLDALDKFPRALYNIIIVKPIEREQTNGSIIMPDEKTLYGIVMSKGKRVEDVEVGDTLMFVYGVYEEFDFENETYYVMTANSDNIKAVL